MTSFFDKVMADSYDERNSRLSPISENLHFLIRLVLNELPTQARILAVGVGTGAEILSLAKANAAWSFLGVDPSAEMLAVCRNRLEQASVLDRCELIHGYVADAPQVAEFDAAVSVLVAHFIKRADRSVFYRQIHDRLKPGGRFVSAEISADLDEGAFPAMLRDWIRIQTLMGATPESLQKLPDVMRNTLGVVSPADTEVMWKEAGFELPLQFFQAFMIRGWHATKK